ncbi:hypothetical protein J3459_004001 [Metarhizium acridum]|nr:hypothetical protein J3459_004001 [Metarhizium acridum]
MFATPSIAVYSQACSFDVQSTSPNCGAGERRRREASYFDVHPCRGPGRNPLHAVRKPQNPESEKADPVANGTKSSVPDEKQAEETATRSEQTDENPKISHTRDVSAVSIGSGPSTRPLRVLTSATFQRSIKMKRKRTMVVGNYASVRSVRYL